MDVTNTVLAPTTGTCLESSPSVGEGGGGGAFTGGHAVGSGDGVDGSNNGGSNMNTENSANSGAGCSGSGSGSGTGENRELSAAAGRTGGGRNIFGRSGHKFIMPDIPLAQNSDPKKSAIRRQEHSEAKTCADSG